MTRIVDRYVYKELLAPIVIGVVVFTFFLFIDRIYQLTNLVITKNVPFHMVFSLLIFMLPTFLALTLPMALLVSVLLVCGRFASDLEVTALKAAGVSPLRLFRPFVVAAVLVTLLMAWLMLVVGPWSSGAFQRQLFKILQKRAATGIKERTFSAAFGQFVLYVDEMSASQVGLKGVIVSDERDPQRLRIIIAKQGRLLTDEENRRITLRFIDGSINETAGRDGRGAGGRFRYTAFSLYDMTLPIDSPLAAGTREEKPERGLPLDQLFERAAQLTREGQIATPYYVEIQKRFALPVATLVFVLVGFPLGIRAHRGGRAVALFASFAIVASYYVLFTSFEGLALSRRLPPWVAMWLPNVLFTVLGVALLRATTVGVSLRWIDLFWRVWVGIDPRRFKGAKPFAERRRPAMRGRRASTFLIDRYLIREYFLFLGLGVLVGTVLFIVVELLHSLDRFLRVKPPLSLILQHFALHWPNELYKGLPLIVLIATVFLFLSLTRQHELDALKAAGVSLYRMSLPILATALCISIGAVIFQEAALPEINAKAEEVDRVRIRGHLPRHLQRQGQIWFRSSDTRFFRMVLLDPREKSIDGLLVLDIDPNFHLVQRLEARKAIWTPEGWQLTDGVVRHIEGTGTVRSEAFESRQATFDEHIDDFTQVQKPPDTMSFTELRAYMTRLQESGHQVGKYAVQLYSKLSFPLVHLIMALVAIPFALASPRSGGRAVAIGVAIVISVGYWMVHSLALAFAQADLLPPALAAWTANIVFAGLGAALFLNVRT